MLLFLAALLGLSFARELPEPNIIYLGSGLLEVSFEDIPGLIFRDISYGSDKELKDAVTGSFYQAADGHWFHKNEKADLKEDHPFFYKVTAFKNGQMVEQSGVWAEDQGKAVAPLPKVVRRSYTVFRDDFTSGSLNMNNWEYEISMYGGYNWEIEVYTNDPANVFIRNGNLYLKPTLTANDPKFSESFLTTGTMDVAKLWGHCTNGDRYGCVRHGRNGLLPPVMSGKIKSKHVVKYGKVTVRAKIPKGDWIWPAIWMLPKTSHYGSWPKSGEIDIMESRGNTVARDSNGHNHGVNEVISTLHWGPDAGRNKFYMTSHGKTNSALWSSDFHIYSLDWNADHIIISVDNAPVLTVPTPSNSFWGKGGFSGNNIWARGGHNAPFDQDVGLFPMIAVFTGHTHLRLPVYIKYIKNGAMYLNLMENEFYLILNVAVGGTNGFFQDNWTYNSRKPWNNNSPTEPADFWSKRNDWLPSWRGDDVAMQVDYVHIEKY